MKTILAIAIFWFTTTLNSEPLKSINYGNAVVEKVTSIYDGDTFRANYDKIIIKKERMN